LRCHHRQERGLDQRVTVDTAQRGHDRQMRFNACQCCQMVAEMRQQEDADRQPQPAMHAPKRHARWHRH
jgi:hypothetical protein